MDSSAINQLLANDTMVFSLIIIIIIAIVLIIIVFQWRKVAQSKNSILMLEKEIELKKMSMVEKDIESKRLMDNPIPFFDDNIPLENLPSYDSFFILNKHITLLKTREAWIEFCQKQRDNFHEKFYDIIYQKISNETHK